MAQIKDSEIVTPDSSGPFSGLGPDGLHRRSIPDHRVGVLAREDKILPMEQ